MYVAKHVPAVAVPRVDSQRCGICQDCSARVVCQTKAIVIIEAGEQPWIDAARCMGCRACVAACVSGAISLPAHSVLYGSI